MTDQIIPNLCALVAVPSVGSVKMQRACQSCGIVFYAFPSEVKRGQRRFCSNECKGRAMAEVAPHVRVDVPCQYCGQTFRVYPCHVVRSKCCSRACAAAHQRRSKGTRPKDTHICAYCGDPSSAKYCNRGCYTKDRTKGGSKCKSYVPAVCIVCGAGFQAYKFDVAKGMGTYCSQSCFGRNKATAMKENPYSRARGGKRSDLDNTYFRSAWEANYARYLNWLRDHKQIKDWAYEPETFEFAAIKRGARFYTPDFRLTNNDNSVEYHEIKGWMDSRSATKLKRMAKYHPKVKLVLIDKQGYTAIARTVGKLMIPNWEWNAKHSN